MLIILESIVSCIYAKALEMILKPGFDSCGVVCPFFHFPFQSYYCSLITQLLRAQPFCFWRLRGFFPAQDRPYSPCFTLNKMTTDCHVELRNWTRDCLLLSQVSANLEILESPSIFYGWLLLTSHFEVPDFTEHFSSSTGLLQHISSRAWLPIYEWSP